jgi:RNA-directed DNA polymerase
MRGISHKFVRLWCCEFFPRRGGNYNNTSNAGLGYENVNNTRGNTNINNGARPALPPARCCAATATLPARVEVKGLISFDDAGTHRQKHVVPRKRPKEATQKCDARRGGNMRKETNVIERIADFDNLLNAARLSSKGKRYHSEVLSYQQNIGENLLTLERRFLNDEYVTGPYHEHYVFVPQWRLVHIPPFNDRVAQQAIYQVIGPILDKQYIYDSYACRKGKGSLAAADRLQYWLRQISRKPDAEKWHACKMDVAKFFYRIDHDSTLSILSQYVDDRIFMNTMERIIRCEHTPFGLPEGRTCRNTTREERLFNVGIPIGSLMSQTVANMDMNEVDQYAKHVLHIHFYVRYMDDIVILHNDLKQLHEWMEAIKSFMYDRLKLKCNSKTGIVQLSHGIEFVGYRIWATHRLLRKKTVQHMKNSLKQLVQVYAHGDIQLDYVQHVLSSYFGLLKHCDSYSIRRWISDNIVFSRDEKTNDVPELQSGEIGSLIRDTEPEEGDFCETA